MIKKLQEIINFNQEIIDSIPDELVVLDTQKRIILANKQVYKSTGLRPEQVIGKKCFDILHKGRKTISDCQMQQTLKSKKTRRIEHTEIVRGKNKYYSIKTTPIINANGKISQVLHIRRDITMRKEAELALQKSRHRYKRLIQNAPLGVISIDSLGNIVDSNAKLVQMLGSPSVKATRSINVLRFPSLIKSGISGDFRECLDGRTITNERLYKSKWGKELCMRYHLTPLRNNDGKIIGAEALVEDITKKRMADKELKQVNIKLLTLYKTSSSLQHAGSVGEILDIALETFKSVGFDRVRIYLLEEDKLVGAKASHLKQDRFKKVVLVVNEDRKAFSAIRQRKPVIIKDKHGRYTRILGKTNVKESASLPLMMKDIVIGAISIDNKFSKRPIRKEELNNLMTFANQIAAAIENSILYSENQKKLRTLTALYDVSSALSGILDLGKILNMIVIKMVKLLKVDVCSIMLMDEAKSLVQKTVYDRNDEYSELLHKVDEAVSKQTVAGNKRQYIRDIRTEPMLSEYIDDESPATLLSEPFSIENMPIGVINLYTKQIRVYGAEELNLIHSLANQAAIIIENTKLYNKIKSDKDNLSAILDISREISSTLEQKPLLKMILDKTVEFTGSECGFVVHGSDITLSSGIPDLRKELAQGGICCHIMKNAKPVVIPDVSKDKRCIPISADIRSEAAIPLLIKGKVTGVLVLESRKIHNFKRFKKSLHILTNQIAIALENARLYDEIQGFNHRLKDEIQYATKELRQKNIELKKMDELKTDFVSNVSHELRTPLTSIVGYTKLLLLEKLGKLNKKQHQGLEIIVEEGDRLTRMINNVLDLSRLESGKIKFKMTEIDLQKLAAETVKSINMQADDKGVSLKLKSKRLPKIKANQDLLKQVFINLINNAIKFTPHKGKVIIKLDKTKDSVIASVSDTGEGISEELIPKLFDKFYQIDSSMTRAHGGSGLGLVIVKLIIDAHKGRIWVDSKEGSGSTFTFTLPR